MSENWLVGAIVAASLVYVVVRARRAFKSGGCGCGCEGRVEKKRGGCAGCDGCGGGKGNSNGCGGERSK